MVANFNLATLLETAGKDQDQPLFDFSSTTLPTGGNIAPIISNSPSDHIINRNEQEETPADSKRTRHYYKPSELVVLWEAYNENPYPESAVYKQLAEQIGVTVEKIKWWFAYKRMQKRQTQHPEEYKPKKSNYRRKTEVKPKEARHRFTKEQNAVLWNQYLNDPFPTPARREQIAEEIGVTAKKVASWFVVRRHLAKEGRLRIDEHSIENSSETPQHFSPGSEFLMHSPTRF